MASSDNVTNEKPIDFEDGEYDPDLEVRLYAEIYYSNETYLPDYESSISNDKATLNVDQNAETTLSSVNTLVSNNSLTDGNPALVNTESQLPTNNFVEELTPGINIETDDRQNSDIGPLYYPKSDWVFGEVSESTRDCEAIERRFVIVRSAGRKQRQLAQKGLWLPPENTERNGSTIELPNATPIHRETPTVDELADVPTDVERLSANQENGLTRNDSCTQENNKRKRKRKNQKNNVSKQACSKKTLPQHDAMDDTGITIETDKNEVASKRKKMKKKKRNAAPQIISSDSEDSIVEVPVPPKPPPLIIQLADSEDECDPSAGVVSKKTNKSPVKKNNGPVSTHDPQTDSSTPDAASKSPVAESNPSTRHEISNEATDTAIETADVSVEAACPDEGNTLILNCTEIQRGASTLDEIRRMRETVPSINAHSDDSMTESEATNWVNIAARQSDAPRNQDICSVNPPNEVVNVTARQVDAAKDRQTCSVNPPNEVVNVTAGQVDATRDRQTGLVNPPIEVVNVTAGQVAATRDRQTCSVDLSNETANIELWNQTKHKNSASAGIPTEIPSTSSGSGTVNRTVANKEKTSSVSTKNKEVAGVRKRQKETASKPFTDFDVPAIPQKRSKRLQDKAMSDYFFKPMSKELQAFYNNPWGGENLNVNDIQSRMPANPRCWGILDADLQGPTSKKRRACPRCNTDSHIGRRCPEKAKEVCCYMCGVKGHVESRCPNTMCLSCGRKYATYRPTCDYCSKLYCNICNGSGHSNDNCPDLWRRYHNTTTETIPIVPRDPLNIMKAPQFLSCCNCGKRGHDATTCQQLRWSQHFPTPMSVSSYTEGPFYESSNRDQMQYESSNRDQMQYESSNRDQMQYESSNRDQMQYESSNRDPMPYESSNRDQMQYESSNREQAQYESLNGQQMQYQSSIGQQTQCALPSEDWIHDVPYEKRNRYPNPNAVSTYVPQHQEQIQDTTSRYMSCKDIEVFEVYNGPGPSIAEPMSSVPSSNVIFQTGDIVLPGTAFLRSASRRLDKVKNIHLDGLLNGRLKPMFLLTWKKSFEFSLGITRESNNIIRMTIEADSPMLLHGLEKVMMQWLQRTDDEKPNLEYNSFPYDDVNKTIENVKEKMMLLRTVLEPTILQKKIVAGEESLKHIRAKHSRCPNQKKAQKRYEKNENGIISNTMKRRTQLVTSLYSHSWVNKSGGLVQSFKDAAHKLIGTKNLAVHHYLDLIYLNNEIFTLHTSVALSKALDNAILASRRSEKITAPIPKKPSVDMSGGKPPESSTQPTAKVDVSEKKKSTVHLPNQPMINNNGLSSDCSPLTQHREQKVTVIEDTDPHANLQIPKIFGTTDVGNTISSNTKDGTGIDSHTVPNPLFRPASVKGVNSQAPSSFQRKIIKSGGPKKIGQTTGLLRFLTKGNRKQYRNLARQAIKRANLTKIPHLHEMAKALKVKSGNGSITTEDVDRLQAAIGPKLSQQVTQLQDLQRLHESCKHNHDDVYNKFLKSL